MKILAWLVGIPVALLLGLLVLGGLIQAFESPESRAKDAAAAREKCAKAITSSMGTNTTNYRDKQAYDQHVAENCKGFDLKR